MKSKKILYVCSEVTPYTDPTPLASTCRTLPQTMQECGNEIRIFMPRYGSINERRGQLHEVIRLSGMNLIIGNSDHQLIIKVASIAGARVQVYFIDNDDYFSRKATFADAANNYFEDNDERAIFFSRGVIETVKKLRWAPDVVHCHGWMAAAMPLYLKRIFASDPIFSKSKVVVSLYDDDFPGAFDAAYKDSLRKEGAKAPDLTDLDNPTFDAVMNHAVRYADGLVKGSQKLHPELERVFEQFTKPRLEAWAEGSSTEGERMNRFYEEVLSC